MEMLMGRIRRDSRCRVKELSLDVPSVAAAKALEPVACKPDF
jgi:hypothetical protein